MVEDSKKMVKVLPLTAQDRRGPNSMELVSEDNPLECERLMGYPDNWTEGTYQTLKDIKH